MFFADFLLLLFPARGASLAAPSKGMGMKLGKAQKANQFLESLKAEGEVIVEDSPVVPLGGGSVAAIPTDPVTVSVEEKLVALWKRDGGLENLEIQGTMALTVLKEEDAFIRVHVSLPLFNSCFPSQFPPFFPLLMSFFSVTD